MNFLFLKIDMKKVGKIVFSTFFILMGKQTFAAKLTRDLNSSKELIEKARHMAVQQKRKEGQDLLIDRLKNLKNTNNDWVKIKTTLNDLSNQFFSEKALALFELAESHLYAKRFLEALSRYREAQQIEPENTNIQSAIVRTLIAQGECQEAEKMARQSLQSQPYDDWLRIMLLRSQNCEEQKGERQKNWELEAIDFEKWGGGFPIVWLKAQAAFRSSISSVKIMKKIMNDQPQFPESRYYLFLQIEDLLEKNKLARQYINLCKKNDQMIRRHYKYEPQLCDQVQLMEDFISKGEVTQ